MSDPVIEIKNLSRRYGKLEAVARINLTVPPGRCYGFFGRNGAGKTTTVKCMLNLLRPDAGTVRVFGKDPRTAEVAVKSRLSYVPDAVAFYPWMTVRGVLDYLASFREHWNAGIEADLLGRFRLPCPLVDRVLEPGARRGPRGSGVSGGSGGDRGDRMACAGYRRRGQEV